MALELERIVTAEDLGIDCERFGTPVAVTGLQTVVLPVSTTTEGAIHIVNLQEPTDRGTIVDYRGPVIAVEGAYAYGVFSQKETPTRSSGGVYDLTGQFV